jgi:hypothetical protein
MNFLPILSSIISLLALTPNSAGGISSINLSDRPVQTNLNSRSITVKIDYQPIRLGDSPQNLDAPNLRYQIIENGQVQTQGRRNTMVFGRVFLKDLDKSGTPEVIVETFSGGAHCCTSAFIYTKRQGKFQVVETGPKDGGGVGYQDLDGDGTIELISKDQSFYYAFSAYAFSFPPSQIFSLKDGKLVDTTRNYPRYLRAELQRMFAAIERLTREDGQINGVLAGYVAQKALLGEFDQGWQFMLARYDRKSDWGLVTYDQQGKEVSRYRDFPTALRAHLRRYGYLR